MVHMRNGRKIFDFVANTMKEMISIHVEEKIISAKEVETYSAADAL